MSEDFGLLYKSLFTGSMVGAGPVAFSVMSYVIANGYGGTVDLHPALLAATFGKCTTEDVEDAIAFLCAPDPRSRTQTDDGRRLRPMTGVRYEIINHELYKSARALEAKRVYDRQKKRESRDRQRTTDVPILDLSNKSLTDIDPLLSLSSSSDLIDPEGVQGEGEGPIRAPADFAPTDAQRARCRKLGLDAEELVAHFKRHEFTRRWSDWEARFDTWIDEAARRKPSRRSIAPPCGLEPTEAHRQFAKKHGLDPGVVDAIVADLVARDVPGTLGLGRARELIGSALSKAARDRARAQATAA